VGAREIEEVTGEGARVLTRLTCSRASHNSMST
jgi:hypothetical protein